FGFKERPFQLVPNPEYLYLGRSHEEALAHLNYAISHGDGFVEITGEVGTGKTTLCRAFLDSLDENTEVAYIFNPRMSALELLRGINDEFDIDSGADNPKDLIDTLNAFLMEKKTQNKKAILLIDEAQNLSMEVLEQLRLLSNLETNTTKLLQIILVGQPELQKILDSYSLRQLRQRITLSWYLTPLNRKETRGYIRHRVNIASKKSVEVFTPTAYDLIYKYSGGIPRLINITCDRALLTAFGFNRDRVTGSIARSSIKELKERGRSRQLFFKDSRFIIAVLLVVCLALPAAFLLNEPTVEQPGTIAAKKTIPMVPPPVESGTPATVAKNNAVVNPLPVTSPAVTTIITPGVSIPLPFEDFIKNLKSGPSRFTALEAALSQWKTTPVLNRYLEKMENDASFFQLAAVQNDFQLQQIGNDFELIKRLDLPTIIVLSPPEVYSPGYLTILKMTAESITLKGGEKNEIITLKPAELKQYWVGKAYIIWKNFHNCTGAIPNNAPAESIVILKNLLREIGFSHLNSDTIYDIATRQVIEKIQQKHGLCVDGIVGDLTKIVIYNENKGLKIPHIWSKKK
ncbi:MAG: AAA family ATPase, partial [bacterium]|nr:AAA family ATPase [bacterium]